MSFVELANRLLETMSDRCGVVREQLSGSGVVDDLVLEEAFDLVAS